jgi:hypothetical protein
MQLDRVTAVFTGGRQDVRELLTEHLGQPLTPEIAASIELAATRSGLELTRHQKTFLLTEAMMGKKPADIRTTHYFTPGVYAREIEIPKGTVLVGAVHRVQNLAIVSKGCMELLTDSGTVIVSAGGRPINCMPGNANAALALEDSVWTNFFPNPTNETDPDKLVEQVAFIKASEVGGQSENRQVIAYAQALALEMES